MDAKDTFPVRKRLRLKNYDYSSPGAYFITFCTHERHCTLSIISGKPSDRMPVGAIHESPAYQFTHFGRSIQKYIEMIPERFDASVDCYAIMPNHVHLIIVLPYRPEVYGNAARRRINERKMIEKILGYIKMRASKEIRAKVGDIEVWQRSFHDHIIRDRMDYVNIATYIRENPMHWQEDCFYTK